MEIKYLKEKQGSDDVREKMALKYLIKELTYSLAREHDESIVEYETVVYVQPMNDIGWYNWGIDLSALAKAKERNSIMLLLINTRLLLKFKKITIELGLIGVLI